MEARSEIRPDRPVRRRVAWVVAAVVAGLVWVVLPAPSAGAAEAVPTRLSVASPAGQAGRTVTLRVVLSETAGAPVAGARIVVERTAGGAPVVLTGVTGADGAAEIAVPLSASAAENLLSVTFAGSPTHAATSARHQLRLTPAASSIRLRAPSGVVQGKRALFTATWVIPSGVAVAGVRLQLQRKNGGTWSGVRSATTSKSGVATFSLTPKASARYRIAGRATAVATSPASATVRVKLRPIIAAVQMPRGAPKPRVKLPPQPLSFTTSARAVTTPIPDGVWRSMVGRSWHRGCLPRGSLRLIRVNYWDYQGFRRRGELVVARTVAPKMAKALTALYQARLPIRSMYRVDRFGWSKRLHGADDYASMAAGNTSAFNCRNVVGRPGVLSPHARGRSLDLNPWENPYASAQDGWVPNRWWVGRCHATVGWCTSSHRVVRTLRAHGLRWSYGTRDRHHFDG